MGLGYNLQLGIHMSMCEQFFTKFYRNTEVIYMDKKVEMNVKRDIGNLHIVMLARFERDFNRPLKF